MLVSETILAPDATVSYSNRSRIPGQEPLCPASRSKNKTKQQKTTTTPKHTQLLPPFQSSLLGGVGVVEIAVGTVAAAVLIRGNIEPSHFGFLHAGTGRKRGCSGEHWAPFVLGGAPARAAACEEGRGGASGLQRSPARQPAVVT